MFRSQWVSHHRQQLVPRSPALVPHGFFPWDLPFGSWAAAHGHSQHPEPSRVGPSPSPRGPAGPLALRFAAALGGGWVSLMCYMKQQGGKATM